VSTSLVATYTYDNELTSACHDDCFLYALTDIGVEVYALWGNGDPALSSSFSAPHCLWRHSFRHAMAALCAHASRSSPSAALLLVPHSGPLPLSLPEDDIEMRQEVRSPPEGPNGNETKSAEAEVHAKTEHDSFLILERASVSQLVIAVEKSSKQEEADGPDRLRWLIQSYMILSHRIAFLQSLPSPSCALHELEVSGLELSRASLHRPLAQALLSSHPDGAAYHFAFADIVSVSSSAPSAPSASSASSAPSDSSAPLSSPPQILQALKSSPRSANESGLVRRCVVIYLYYLLQAAQPNNIQVSVPFRSHDPPFVSPTFLLIRARL